MRTLYEIMGQVKIVVQDLIPITSIGIDYGFQNPVSSTGPLAVRGRVGEFSAQVQRLWRGASSNRGKPLVIPSGACW